MRRFQARSCTNPDCGLRFPVDEGSALGSSCPRCGAPTRLVDTPYTTAPAPAPGSAPGPPLLGLLDNIRSLSNVGTIFRTADGVGATHLHLGGVTPTPDHPRLAKTALGAEASVPWSHHPDPVRAAHTLVEAGIQLWVLEGGEGPALLDLLPARPDLPICLVVGHEVSGVDPRVAGLAEHVTHLPMAGIKGSLNVAVAFGVAAYALRYGLAPR